MAEPRVSGIEALYDGPLHCTIVLNGTRDDVSCCTSCTCCCGYCHGSCGPQPIHPGSIELPSHGPLSHPGPGGSDSGPTETVYFNMWAGNSLPPQVAGRDISPKVWVDCVNAISTLEMGIGDHKGTFDQRLAQIEAEYAPRLGAKSFTKMGFEYQVWVPGTTGTNAHSDSYGRNTPGTPGVPAHWEPAVLHFLRVDFDTPCADFAAPAGEPTLQAPQQQQLGYIPVQEVGPQGEAPPQGCSCWFAPPV